MKKLFLILTVALLTITTNAQWQQIGSDIDGEASYDYSGCSSLSSDGSVVAIGAWFNNGNGSFAGHVRIYQNNSGTWSQIGYDINGEAAGDNSGRSVSLSSDGSVVAIGATGNDGNGNNAGHVRVYQNIAGTWQQIGSDIDGEAAGDLSGYSISLSSDGSVVAIGAPGNKNNGSDAGHVRVFQNNAGTWQQVGSDIDGEAAMDQSGASVSLSSDGLLLAIGAYFNDGNSSDAGHVRIYQNNSGTWQQMGNDLDGEAAGDGSGYSISLSSDGSIVAIGAFYNDGNGKDAGHVRVYQNISGTWQQLGSDIDGKAADDGSGYSVSLSSDGSVVAIGAPWNDGDNGTAGHVRVYQNIGGTWTQIGSDIDGEAANDRSGYSVSLSSDGSVVAIGADYNDGNGNYAGHVRLYRYCSYSTITITEIACNTYISPSGQIWSNSGTYLDTIANALGCDSIISINLTIDTVDVSVSVNGITLIAALSGANYQWIDCNNNYMSIPGDTNQSFTPFVNGDYAVIVDDNVCKDTSICYNINSIGIGDNDNMSSVHIYPNPNSGIFIIESDTDISDVKIYNVVGKLVYDNRFSREIDIAKLTNGVYFIKLYSDEKSVINTFKIIKQ